MRVQLASSPSYKHLKIIEIVPPLVQTELHDMLPQSDRAGGRKPMGMPLDEFTEKTWSQLVEGRGQVLVGTAETTWERWEGERQKQFMEIVQHVGVGVPNT
jgi:short-subunit dehydrogenase involved in D-alanine esterification of teichoic acids